MPSTFNNLLFISLFSLAIPALADYQYTYTGKVGQFVVNTNSPENSNVPQILPSDVLEINILSPSLLSGVIDTTQIVATFSFGNYFRTANNLSSVDSFNSISAPYTLNLTFFNLLPSGLPQYWSIGYTESGKYVNPGDSLPGFIRFSSRNLPPSSGFGAVPAGGSDSFSANMNISQESNYYLRTAFNQNQFGEWTIQQIAAVPEPSTYLMLGLGLGLILLVSSRQKSYTSPYIK